MAPFGQEVLELIDHHPLKDKLSPFRAAFELICREKNTSDNTSNLDVLDRADLGKLIVQIALVLHDHPVSSLVSTAEWQDTLQNDLHGIISTLGSVDLDIGLVKKLLHLALALEKPGQDTHIWDIASQVFANPTYSQSTAPLGSQTPHTSTRNTGALPNTKEHRSDVDTLLHQELRSLSIRRPTSFDTFFKGVPDLRTISKAVFSKCEQGRHPLFKKTGWHAWPSSANESDVVAWFNGIVPKLEALVRDRIPVPAFGRKLRAKPRTPLQGSTAKRSLDIGFVESDSSTNDRTHWSQIVVPGELKSNPSADKPTEAWISLATYAREVFAAQPSRRFTLGFTLCGSLMRLWEFDRLGAIASEKFNINSKSGGLQFVISMLGFLHLDAEGLGYDPTVSKSSGGEFVEIKRDGKTERLNLVEVMYRSRCISRGGTTCWKAHLASDPQTTLIIKDTWQYSNRDEEGELFREATAKGVANLARYYHHETVCHGSAIDDVRSNVRRGLDLDMTKVKRSSSSAAFDESVPGSPRQEQSASAGSKRGSRQIGAALPPKKRTRSSISNDSTDSKIPPNRVHRRVVLMDHGSPIYKAHTTIALLNALEGCIIGHESLLRAGILHRDISINNLLIQQDYLDKDPKGLLIDLDMAVRIEREHASGAPGKTGTRAFMAIGALLGHQHSFMHDLESFFWVIFWICVHYDGPGKDVGATKFDRWNYEDDGPLVAFKRDIIAEEARFFSIAKDDFTPYHRPLTRWVNKLRRVIFPQGHPWRIEDKDLYSKMREILRQARLSYELRLYIGQPK